MAKKKTDPYAEFRAMPRHEQRLNMLHVTDLCWDGAPVSLARKIEIYLANEGCDFDCSICHAHLDDED